MQMGGTFRKAILNGAHSAGMTLDLCPSPDCCLHHGQGAEAGVAILQPLVDQHEVGHIMRTVDGRAAGGWVSDGIVGAAMLDLTDSRISCYVRKQNL